MLLLVVDSRFDNCAEIGIEIVFRKKIENELIDALPIRADFGHRRT